MHGIDNLNPYYDVKLKEDRLHELQSLPNFTFTRGDIADATMVKGIFADFAPHAVVHLAAQAGVRYSLQNPQAYVDANITGFLNILEGCRAYPVGHLIFASSSSVYGSNIKQPFAETDAVDHPVSLYAASKKANEMMAHTYAHLFDIPSTGLRFFTVYGPWGRPDMALFKFMDAITHNRPIEVYNNGEMRRDFTYIDDIIEGIVRLIPHVPIRSSEFATADLPPDQSWAPYRLYNIGNHDPVQLMEMIAVLEEECGKTATKNLCPMQPGDVPATYADTAALQNAVGFAPRTPLRDGIRAFVSWYRNYYQ